MKAQQIAALSVEQRALAEKNFDDLATALPKTIVVMEILYDGHKEELVLLCRTYVDEKNVIWIVRGCGHPRNDSFRWGRDSDIFELLTMKIVAPDAPEYDKFKDECLERFF
ncbi:hypothetical protein HZC00_04185 [Candidatus Kaiserbacteria bacterium]|nr:hypothetical protein [Candidatus Kaiserbacteria bacterium]